MEISSIPKQSRKRKLNPYHSPFYSQKDLGAASPLKARRTPKKTLSTRTKTYGLISLTILAIIISTHILLNRPEAIFNPGEKKARA